MPPKRKKDEAQVEPTLKADKKPLQPKAAVRTKRGKKTKSAEDDEVIELDDDDDEQLKKRPKRRNSTKKKDDSEPVSVKEEKDDTTIPCVARGPCAVRRRGSLLFVIV